LQGPDIGQATVGSTSSSLIRQVQTHEPEAWDRHCALCAPLVVDRCRPAGLQSADTADTAQNVFLSVCQSIGPFRWERPTDSFHGRHWTIARNAVRLHFRKAGQQAAVVSQLPPFFDAPSQPDSPAQFRRNHLARLL